MIGIGTALVGLGIDFVKDMIQDNGEDLVKQGIKKVTGIDLDKQKELTPEQVQMIKDNEYKLRALDFEELKLEYENTNNARNMQVEALRQEDLFSKRYIYYLATFWSIVGVVYIFMITFANIPEDNVRFADTVLGFLLGTIVATIINFFFGSSKGSKDKHDSIHSLINRKDK